MFKPGSSNLKSLSGNNSTVGVGNKTIERAKCSTSSIDGTSSSSMFKPGSSNLKSLSGNNSTIGMSNIASRESGCISIIWGGRHLSTIGVGDQLNCSRGGGHKGS